jgi:biotin operon repressor
MPLRYGEGSTSAFKRLEEEIHKQNKCLQDLRLTDPRDDKKRIEDTKGGLLKDSYRWILDNSDFQRWRNDQSRLLWIKGNPGKGKTMLLCGIIDELDESIGTTALLSYFFCQATDSRIKTATAVLRGLIYMLIGQQPSLITHIWKKYDRAGEGLFKDANTWVALVEIFTDILQDPNLNKTYLIIDALDECVTDLPKLLNFIVQSSTSPHVKWIVSSRNWPDIDERLKNAGRNLSLELNVDSVSTAVKIFIQHKVLQLTQQKSYNDETRDAVLDYLSSNADNTFLWVALVCQNLGKIPRWKTFTKLTAFPPGLDPLYGQMVEQVCNSDDANLCRRILATMSLAYRPLTLKELTSVVETLEDMSDDLISLQEIVNLCGSLLTVREDTVYFVHQSAKDYLLAQAFDEIFPSGEEETHYTFLSRSLQIMRKTLRRDIYNLRAPGYPIEQVNQPDPDPLAASRYSCIYWVDHLCAWNSKSRTEHRVDLRDGGAVEIFMRKKYLYWLEALSLCRGISDGVVSMTKLEALLQVIFISLMLRILHTDIS